MTGTEGAGRRERFADAVRAERPEAGALCLLVSGEADPAFDDVAADRTGRELDRLAAEVARHPSGRDGTPRGGRSPCGTCSRVRLRLSRAAVRLRPVGVVTAARGTAPAARAADPAVGGVDGGGPPGRRPGLRGGTPGTLRGRDRRSGRPPCAGRSVRRRPGADQGARRRAHGRYRRCPNRPRPGHSAAEPLEIIARVLNNIRIWAASRPEHTAVQLWAARTAAPAAPPPGPAAPGPGPTAGRPR